LKFLMKKLKKLLLFSSLSILLSLKLRVNSPT